MRGGAFQYLGGMHTPLLSCHRIELWLRAATQ
jgi:hypothetical protein